MREPSGRRSGPRKDSARIKELFLAAYVRWGAIAPACKEVVVDRSSVEWWRQHDAGFLARFQAAEKEIDDTLEAEIKRRAVDGYLKPVFYHGAQVAEVREYSDHLLMFLAKGRLPKYKDRIDFTTGDKPLGYSHLIDDPQTAELAAQFAERAAITGLDPRGPGTAGE